MPATKNLTIDVHTFPIPLFVSSASLVVMRQSFGSSKISFILLAGGRCHLFPPKGALVVATPLFSFSKSGDD